MATKRDSKLSLRRDALKAMCEVVVPKGWTPIPKYTEDLEFRWEVSSSLYNGFDTQGFPRRMNHISMRARADHAGFVEVSGNGIDMRTIDPIDLQKAVDLIIAWRSQSEWLKDYDSKHFT